MQQRNWYAIHTYSGHEKKVKTNIERRADTMGLRGKIYEILVPEEAEQRNKDGKKTEVKRKVFPGYVLIDMVLDSLPRDLCSGRELFMEGCVHRWVGSVNGLPAGYPAREPDSRHLPEPKEHPSLFVVGDYLFDSTLNGVLDSADVVAEWILEELVDETADNVAGKAKEPVLNAAAKR